jgi:hypothetical protein
MYPKPRTDSHITINPYENKNSRNEEGCKQISYEWSSIERQIAGNPPKE